MLNLGVHTESQIEPFIWTTGVNCSNSLNHDQVQVLSYSKYSLLLLGLKLQSPDDFTQKYFPTKHLYHLCHVSLLDICTRSWLTELEQSTPVVQIKGSIQDEVNSPNILSNNNKASSQKFRQMLSIYIFILEVSKTELFLVQD